MGRKKKVYSGEVEDYLKENGSATVGQMAEDFECCKPTIRKRLRDLRNQKKPVIPTRVGIIYADKITDEARALLVKNAMNWVVSSLISLASVAAVGQQPLLQAKRLLQSPEDRRQIRAQLMMLKSAIDIIDIDHQLTS